MRRIVKLAIAAACTVGIAMGASGTSAEAATASSVPYVANVIQGTADGEGIAVVSWTNAAETEGPTTKTSSTYAMATIINDYSGFALNGWLERSTNGGNTWSNVSSVHAFNNGSVYSAVNTYAYYDGPGYLARACFQFTSWSGAAVHCSPGI